MAKAYTNLQDLKIDLQLYVNLQTSGQLDLSLFPALAKQRYPWIVANWNDLYAVFKTYSNGDEELEAALKDFDSSVQGYKLSTSTNPLNTLENAEKFEMYSEFLSLISIQGIGLTAAEISLVSLEIQRIANLTIDDFRSMLSFMNKYISIRASSLGLYDADGFSALNAPSVSREKAATVSDLSSIGAMIESRKYIESIILSLKASVDRPPNLLTTANANISGGNVTVNTAYVSAIAVPFMISLENMAKMYLDDSALWYELVTVNNLQPPYVDEVGKKYLLVAPGAGNNVTISADRRNDLHVGASVAIGSVRMREEQRVVNRMSYNNDNTMVLYLSGEADLNKLQKTEGAFVRIYAPHTMNSGSFIKIPLNVSTGLSSGLTPKNDELRRLDQALLNFGIDVAQDDVTGDLSVAANGNFTMAYGLKNVRQTVSNIINTVKGELPFHPNYGLDSSIGYKMFGPGDMGTIISEMVTQSIQKDKRFTSVVVKNLTMSGTSVSMLVVVKIQGSSQLIPLSFVG